jgi:hypothetical protein
VSQRSFDPFEPQPARVHYLCHQILLVIGLRLTTDVALSDWRCRTGTVRLSRRWQSMPMTSPVQKATLMVLTPGTAAACRARRRRTSAVWHILDTPPRSSGTIRATDTTDRREPAGHASVEGGRLG